MVHFTLTVEASKTASPKQRIDRPSSDTPQLFRYNHPPDSVLAGDFFCKKDFFCKRKIKVLKIADFQNFYSFCFRCERSHLYCDIRVKQVIFSRLVDEICEMGTSRTPIRFIILHCLAMRSGMPTQSGCLHQDLHPSFDYAKLTIFCLECNRHNLNYHPLADKCR